MSELVIAEKADLIAIADQLRTLANKTEDMSISQMAAEVSNANANKTDILSALTEKGVDATGAGLADIAGLVAGIQSGGSGDFDFSTLPHPFTSALSGTFTPSSNATYINVYFENIPRVYVVYAETLPKTSKALMNAIALGLSDDPMTEYDTGIVLQAFQYYTYQNNFFYRLNVDGALYKNPNYWNFMEYNGSKGWYFKAPYYSGSSNTALASGTTYHWFALF